MWRTKRREHSMRALLEKLKNFLREANESIALHGGAMFGLDTAALFLEDQKKNDAKKETADAAR